VPVQRVSRPGRPGLEGRPRGAVTQGMKLRLRSRPTASAEGPSDAVTWGYDTVAHRGSPRRAASRILDVVIERRSSLYFNHIGIGIGFKNL
jgi:hypothetical protein